MPVTKEKKIMANLKNFTLDPNKASKGVWIEFDDQTKFLIGSINSREYEFELMNEYKPYRHPARSHLLDKPEIVLKHRIKAMAKCVLLGWTGLMDTTDGKEVEVPYTVESAIQVLSQSPEIRSFVEAEATKRQNFNLAVEEAAAGNLKSGS